MRLKNHEEQVLAVESFVPGVRDARDRNGRMRDHPRQGAPRARRRRRGERIPLRAADSLRRLPHLDPGTPWAGQKLGTHGYYYRPSEKNGIGYACRAGHVDIMHVRIAADWTAYLPAKATSTS
jgi:hypothetical protein